MQDLAFSCAVLMLAGIGIWPTGLALAVIAAKTMAMLWCDVRMEFAAEIERIGFIAN